MPAAIKASEKFNILSKPKDGVKGKPCLGGIAIYVSFVSTLAAVYFLKPGIHVNFYGLVISSAIIVVLGLVDDIKDLKPAGKITVELLAAGFLMLFGTITKISFFPAWLNILVTCVWVLLITNAFNLLDIVDGLTSGLVIIISLTLLVISLVNKDIFSSMILTALIGAHAGFLRYNYPPAKIYMGDAGSLLSGFLLAGIAINISYAPLEKPIALITPLIAMSLPVYDTLFLIIMRAGKKKPIFNKSDDHFALRLMVMGYSVRKSVWTMYTLSIFLAVSSLIVAFAPNTTGILTTIVVLSVFFIIGRKFGMIKVA